ncbi:MAG: cellulase family glycosylhydrolase, partial [Chloroflexi bacterium]|nr:cellulase family glycosylhydrolase [Chloroflexota bacterium]
MRPTIILPDPAEVQPLLPRKFPALRRFFWYFVIALLFISTQNDAGRDSKMSAGSAISPFVRASGRSLVLNGKPYKFLGVNRYDLLTIPNPYRGCGYAWRNPELNQLFTELRTMGVNTVRMSAFRLFTDSGADFSRFDTILTLARENGIKVIPVLENQWENCTLGGNKTSNWYREGYKQRKEGFPVSYKEYVAMVVNKYKNDPTILMWQLMGEAESKDILGAADPQALLAFSKDMSEFVKTLDPNHLVSLGTLGGN